jgi:hypothetical protein
MFLLVKKKRTAERALSLPNTEISRVGVTSRVVAKANFAKETV